MDSAQFSALDSLKDCAKPEDICHAGIKAHARVAAQGSGRDLLVRNALVHMYYARCGALSRARALVLGLLPSPRASARCAPIAANVAHGFHKEALLCWDHTKPEESFFCLRSGALLSCCLKACAQAGDSQKGQELHIEMAKRGAAEEDQVLCNGLIHMYAQTRRIREAIHVFEDAPHRDVVSWTALMAGFMRHGLLEEALECLAHMRITGISPDSVALLCCLKACSSVGDAEIGRETHLQITKLGFLAPPHRSDASLGNALLDLYANCGGLDEARDVFDRLPSRDVVSWTALIAAYAERGHVGAASESLEKMHRQGLAANEVPFLCILKACASENAANEGRKMHAEIDKRGLLGTSPSLGNTLVLMYADCGLLVEAQQVFDRLPVADAVPWTALMGGYISYGYGEKALSCFDRMRSERIPPDGIAYVRCLNACASLGALDQGREIHAQISSKGLTSTHVDVGNALVDMYAKCGMFVEAQKVFDDLPIQDTIAWNAVIAGYVKHGRAEVALSVLERMQEGDVPVDVVTLVCGVKACGMLAALEKGRKFHDHISRRGFVEKGPLVGNSLIAMYAECGALQKAREVFEQTPLRDVVSWTLLITGYAQLGEANQVFHLLDRMREASQAPNLVTFVGVFHACSHGGLVGTGYMCFKHMVLDMGITPAIEHYSCMADMLGRAGQLDKVVAIVEHMPLHPNRVIWSTILGACRKWGDMEVGGEAFLHALGLDDEDAASYIIMCNIQTDTEMVNRM